MGGSTGQRRPQFVNPSSRHLIMPYLLLGILVALIGGLCDLSIAIVSARLAHRMHANQRRDAWTKRVCGGLYVGLGPNLCANEHRSTALIELREASLSVADS
jgi:threonine/homoserine/homoserine lactone efflux protein